MIRALGDIVNWLESQSPENLESEILKLPIRFAEETDLSEEQIIMLKEMIRMFDKYHDSKMNLQNLKGIFHQLSNPDSEILLPLSQRGSGKSLFIFDEKMSVKEIVKLVMRMVKNRNNIKTSAKNLPKYRTVMKSKLFKPKEEKTKFSINAEDLLKMRMNFAKREKTKHSVRRKSNLSPNQGRIIRFSKEGLGSIAIIPTILNAIKQGNYSLENRKFNIQTKNFLYPVYEKNIVYNIMLVLDTSKSISWLIPNIEKLISYITFNVYNSRDKIGLITFNNDLAKIYHYPTLNIKQIIGTINKLETKGKTPLGEGLNLALQVLSKDQYKIQGAKNLIILVSDCFPEPLEGGHKDLLNEPSYKLVLSVSEKIRKEKLGFIIINPSEKVDDKLNWNAKLIKKIIEISQAKYIKIHPIMQYNLFKGEKAYISEENLINLTNTIWKTKLDIE